MRLYPEGPIFRNYRGRPFTKHQVSQRYKTCIRSINRKAGRVVVRESVTPYSHRHAFVTRCVRGNKNLMALCELQAAADVQPRR
jgi:hypothetical protein